jgi:hypothetical protein
VALSGRKALLSDGWRFLDKRNEFFARRHEPAGSRRVGKPPFGSGPGDEGTDIGKLGLIPLLTLGPILLLSAIWGLRDL